MKKIGLIAGRHPLPVDLYLLEGQINASPQRQAVNTLYDEIWRAIRSSTCPGDEVEFYPTGLTRATIIAMDAFAHLGVLVQVMEWDSETTEYCNTLEQVPTQVFGTGKFGTKKDDRRCPARLLTK